MSSRLFKHQMASNNRPPVYPHLANSQGEIFNFNKTTAALSKIYHYPVGGGAGEAVAYSPDGKFLAIASSTGTIGLSVYKRTPEGYILVLSNASNYSYFSLAWSPDSQYLAAGRFSSTSVAVWKRNANDTFTAIASAPGNDNRGYTAQFSENGKYYIHGGISTPYVKFYKFQNAVFTPLNQAGLGMPAAGLGPTKTISIGNLFIVPTASSAITSVFFYNIDPDTDVITKVLHAAVNDTYARCAGASRDKKYVAIGGSGPMKLTQYKFENGVFTKLAAPDVLPAGIVRGVTYSPDGEYLLAASTSAPFMTLYRRVGDALVNVPIDPVVAGALTDAAFSPVG